LLVSTAAAIAADPRDLGREVLAPGDGWASQGPGTTGGSAATPDQVYTVHNRQELVAALNNGLYPPPSSNPSNTPKIIYVEGLIDANVDDNNNPLGCTDYYRDGYTLEAFLAAYDPAVWGRTDPTGPLEDARLASRAAQEARVRIRVGSNTTIVGVGDGAIIKGAWLDLRGSASVPRTNIIIRNLNFRDTFDCFPEWSPTDGALGSWNALYDSISLRNTEQVWIDHNNFEDVETSDSLTPHYFGVLFQWHDGLVDITNASDFVTVSWNKFRNHDKVMLIGSSDSATADRGKLRVTLHHNLFEGNGQRTPRVRFGQVHVYNNLYRVRADANYVYSWGVGRESAIYAEQNFFRSDVTPDRFIARYNGTAIHESATYVNGSRPANVVDVLAAYNAVNDPDLLPDVGWQPSLYGTVHPGYTLPNVIPALAGPFNW
jgi:pectate lyase